MSATRFCIQKLRKYPCLSPFTDTPTHHEANSVMVPVREGFIQTRRERERLRGERRKQKERERMKIQCNACEVAEASVVCCADEAALCWACDEKVHAANKLASKHQRVPLSNSSSSHMPKCDICQVTSLFIHYSTFHSSSSSSSSLVNFFFFFS